MPRGQLTLIGYPGYHVYIKLRTDRRPDILYCRALATAGKTPVRIGLHVWQASDDTVMLLNSYLSYCGFM